MSVETTRRDAEPVAVIGLSCRFPDTHAEGAEGAGGFDAGFFGIAPDAAASMDAHRQLLLELGWEALEQAGIVPAALRGGDTGSSSARTERPAPTARTEGTARRMPARPTASGPCWV